MTTPLHLHEDRLFPADPAVRAIARRLYAGVRDLPILSPHGHTDPQWFAGNAPFGNATELLLAPDHYLFRMLYSQGIDLNDLGVGSRRGPSTAVPREAWRKFAAHFYLFNGTPSWLWLNYVFAKIFGLTARLEAATADHYFDVIGEQLAQDDFRPRALFERFNIEVLATTESPVDTLDHHHAIQKSGWQGRIITAYRPDAVIDPEHEQFRPALARFAELTGEDVYSWSGYLDAHRKRRADFAKAGATSTDHGHPTAATADLDEARSETFVRARDQGPAHRCRGGAVPRRDAGRDGEDERRRRAGDANSSRCVPQSQPLVVRYVSAATRARTFRSAPNMCRRCGRCWIASATANN